MDYNIFDNLFDAVLVLDKDYVIRYSNDAFCFLIDVPISKLKPGNKLVKILDHASCEKILPSEMLSTPDKLRKYREVILRNSKKVDFKVQISVNENAEYKGEFVIFMHNVLLEEKFQKKIIEESQKKKQLINELTKSDEELRNKTLELEDKISKFRTEIIEKERIQEKLYDSQRMASIGTLTAGVAHEISNPLTIAVGYAELIDEYLTSKKVRTEYINALIKSQKNVFDRIKNIVKGLGIYHSIKDDKKEILNVKETLIAPMALAESFCKNENITFKVEYPNAEIFVSGNKENFSQAIQCIINNAIDAVMMFEKLLDKQISIYFKKNENNLVIEIVDNGIGIDPSDMKKIFDPFYTTKEPGQGVGLGLTIAQSVILSMKGRISLTSKIDKGTTVLIHIPLEKTKEKIDLVKTKTSIKFEGSALVIDDDEEFREFLNFKLISLGLDVDQTGNALMALEKLKTKNYKYLFVDFVLPGLNGIAFLREVISRNIRAKFILSTTALFDSLLESDRNFLNENGVAFLQKPYTREEIMNLFEKIN